MTYDRPYILVIDDSASDLRRQKSFIESRWEDPVVLAFHFTKASDFQTVCSLIANTPDLSAIVCDIRLPGYPTNGGIISDLRGYLNQIGRVLRIVALSNFPPKNIAQYGADAAVAKGNKEEFLSTLSTFVSGKEAEDLERLRNEIIELKKRGQVVSLSMTKLYCGVQESYELISLRVKGMDEVVQVFRAEQVALKKLFDDLTLQFASRHSEIIRLQSEVEKLNSNVEKLNSNNERLDRVLMRDSTSPKLSPLQVIIIGLIVDFALLAFVLLRDRSIL